MGMRYRKVYRLNGKQAVWLVAAIFLFVGLLFAAIGIGVGVSDYHTREACVEETRGYITSNYPITVAYDVHGMTLTGDTGIRQSPPPYHLNDAVTVWYNPQQPEEFYIDGFHGMLLFAVIFGGVGGLLAVIGFGMLVGGLMKKRKEKQAADNADWF